MGPHLERVAFNRAEEREALRAFGELLGCRVVMALTPAGGGIRASAVRKTDHGWQREEWTWPRESWKEAWEAPEDAVRATAVRAAIEDPGNWSAGRSWAFRPPVILGEAVGASPTSEGMDAHASAMAGALAHGDLRPPAGRPCSSRSGAGSRT